MASVHEPTVYAAGKLPEMRRRWDGALGAAVRGASFRVVPGLPLPGLVGWSANSTGPTENTTDAVAAQRFHEIGYYQTPAGPRDGPAPNPDPNAPNNAWAKLGLGAEFRAILGRGVVLNSRWGEAIVDQAVVGALDYRENGRAVSRALGDLAPSSEASQWFYVLCCFGYSVGVSGGRAAVARYAAELAGTSEDDRFATLLRAAAADPAIPRSTAHALVRAWQRLACGAALAAQLGQDTAWYAVPMGSQQADVEARIAAAYYGGEAGLVPWLGSALGSPKGTVALLLAAAGVLVYAAWRRRK